MPEPRFHLVFSTLIEGRQPAQVYHDLAGLFTITPEQVQQIFVRQGAVVKSDLDRATAEQYVQVILAAGAICVIEPMEPGDPVTLAEDLPSRVQGGTSPAGHAEGEAGAMEPPGTDRDHCVRPDDESRAGETVRAAFTFRTPGLAALMLFAGACLPIVSGAGVHWPWLFAFEPQPPGLLWWVAVPVCAAVMLALLRAPAFSLLVACVGAAALLGTFVVLWEAALVLPLRMLPYDRTAALVFVLPLLGTAVCSAACRAMHELGELGLVRLLAACGSLTVLVPAGSALFIADMIWTRWAMVVLLLGLLSYGALVLVCSCLPSVSERILHRVRLLGMLLACWAPLAVFLAHLPLLEGDTYGALCMAVLKAGLLYYGALAAVAGGLRKELLYRFEQQANAGV